MIDEARWNITPAQLIRNLFDRTADGKLAITYYHVIEEPYTCTYDVTWTAADAEALIEQHTRLMAALSAIASRLDEVAAADDASLLTEEQQTAWEIYARPFEPFEVSLSEIGDLYLRGEYDTLSDEENELLERYTEWLKEQCLQRLPLKGCSPEHLITRARRCLRLMYLQAPDSVIGEEARCLAEEMILYHYGR